MNTPAFARDKVPVLGNKKKPVGRRGSTRSALVTSLCGLLILLMLCLLSLALGSRLIPLDEALTGLLKPNGGSSSLIMWKLRIPRTLAALLIGAALAVAGVLMQALTRNPLAEPGLLGVNSGAAVAVVMGLAFFGVTSPLTSLWLALLGAGLATATVFFIGSAGQRSGMDGTVRLVLAGVALSACLGAVTGIITMFNSRAFDSYRFWVVGSVEGRELSTVLTAAPAIGIGLLLALLLAKPLSALALGEDAAASLGVPVGVIRGVTIAAVMLLCGTATALAGPVSFVGLVVPHILRLLVGVELTRVLPLSLIGGPALVLSADIIGRFIALPGEIEVGIVTAFIGAPALLVLVLGLGKPRRGFRNPALGTSRKDAGAH